MKLVYVSGPYRDPRGTYYVEQNIRAAEEVATRLWGLGFAVICPHANTRHFDGIVSSEQFIEGDLVMVERCDAVVMLPGSEHSRGAMEELHHAKDENVPVFWWPIHLDQLASFADEDTAVCVEDEDGEEVQEAFESGQSSATKAAYDYGYRLGLGK